MPSLAEVQAELGAYLLGPADGAGAGRFDRRRIHRNNRLHAITGSLAAIHPVVERLVGGEFFTAMARAYVAHDPPASPVLIDYGGGFGDFVAGFAPAASLPYLADVARLEWARHVVYHAAQADPLEIGALAFGAPSSLPDISLALHPAHRFLQSIYPVDEIWRVNQDSHDGDRRVELIRGGYHFLVIRPRLEIRLLALDGATFAFAGALARGSTIGGACRAAAMEENSFDVSAALRSLAGAECFVHHSGGGIPAMQLDIAVNSETPARHRLAVAAVLARRLLAALDAFPLSLGLIFARLSVAVVFWMSGRTKMDGWAISDSAIYLFEFEYRLPFIDPVIAVHAAAAAEHFSPLLLLLGLGARFAAVSLMIMIAVIQLLVLPDGWPTHFLWFSLLFMVLVRGPGVISLDHLIRRRWGR